jgi:hypothetical protein
VLPCPPASLSNSRVIGPRISNGPARSSDDVLDRIDEIVAPGVTLNPDDDSYGTTELAVAARRR